MNNSARKHWLARAQAMLDELHASAADAATRRRVAGEAARIAAYGSIIEHTPADYTPVEALEQMPSEEKKRKRGYGQPAGKGTKRK